MVNLCDPTSIFRSKAEKVFRPWWDTLEDYLLNSLVLLGESTLMYSGIAMKNEKKRVYFYTAM